MIVYLDFDGVLFDTVIIIKKLIKENNIDLTKECQSFFENLDWHKILDESNQIGNSIEEIKELKKEYDVRILTHVSSENEKKEKKNFINKVLPNIQIEFVPIEVKKSDYVEAKNNILIDDALKNVNAWIKAGGKSILFDGRKLSELVKECYYD